jgi:hypothetical protein
MVGVTIMMGGYFNGRTVNQLSLTGTALQYGQAGYEFLLAEAPVNSRGQIWVQLYDQSLVPLSDRIYVDTFEDCERNMVLVNFRKIK